MKEIFYISHNHVLLTGELLSTKIGHQGKKMVRIIKCCKRLLGQIMESLSLKGIKNRQNRNDCIRGWISCFYDFLYYLYEKEENNLPSDMTVVALPSSVHL